MFSVYEQNIITSVPYLAPLFRRWVSDFGYRIGYGSRSHTVHTTENYILKSYGKNSVKSSVNHDPTSTISKRTVIRTPSEELILGVGDEPGPREIMRTTEYKVVVDEDRTVKDYNN
jgi:hypothetical protein